MTSQNTLAISGLAGLLAIALMGCSNSGPGEVVRPGDNATASDFTGNLQVHFKAPGGDDEDEQDDEDDTDDQDDTDDTDDEQDDEQDDGDDEGTDEDGPVVETRCGDAVGIRLSISGEGDSQTCEEEWAAVTVSGAFAGGASGDHLIADCFFVVAPGTYSVDELVAVGADGEALECCESTFQASLEVSESETTEISGLIQCETVQNGAVDIFATINTPPTIEDVEISPSKFACPGDEIELSAHAVDPQGDEVTYEWEITAGTGGSLDADGASATFVSSAVGDFEIKVTATDELDASHWLTFPLHIVECDDDEGPGDDEDDEQDDEDKP